MCQCNFCEVKSPKALNIDQSESRNGTSFFIFEETIRFMNYAIC